MCLPSRQETLKMLKDLAEGSITERAAADWATKWVLLYEQKVEDKSSDCESSLDEVVWSVLAILQAADLQTSPTTYLYGPEDFADWYNEFFKKMSGLS